MSGSVGSDGGWYLAAILLVVFLLGCGCGGAVVRVLTGTW